MPAIKTTHLRGANAVQADPQRIGNDVRWATGRNVKRALADRRWDVVESWTLKTRDEAGKVVVVRVHASRADAEAFVQEAR